jgi:hypothetical protein
MIGDKKSEVFMRNWSLFTWKNLSIGLILAFAFFLTGKISYDKGYNRGDREARIEMTISFINSPHNFLNEAATYCSINLYEIMTKNTADGTHGRLAEGTMDTCQKSVKAAVSELTSHQ